MRTDNRTVQWLPDVHCAVDVIAFDWKRLSPSARELANVAAVIGRSFTDTGGVRTYRGAGRSRTHRAE